MQIDIRLVCLQKNIFDIDTIVLDDGFQHRKLYRDRDVVLIDATNPFGGGYVLPAGLLREDLEELLEGLMSL